jgi:hypothetical protein
MTLEEIYGAPIVWREKEDKPGQWSAYVVKNGVLQPIPYVSIGPPGKKSK